jgi:nucleotide-binding universal stress UspA family protein
MMTQTGKPAARRIAVTLDTSESGRAPLEAAARLAAILGAELEGVFVEDVNLIRLSGLPFLREFRTWSTDEEEISTQRMQRELRALAQRAELMLERVAKAKGVPWSFQVWRGRTGAASLASAFGADILSLGRISSLVSSRMFAATRPLARRSRKTDTSISVLFSHSEQASRVMATACSLAKDMGARLTVVLPATPPVELPVLKEKALAILKQHEQVARLVYISGVDASSLEGVADATGIRILITEAEHPLLQQADIDQCLENLFCPVLLVR